MSGLPSRVETVIVGGGQAGLTMSAYLREAGREHIVLERRDSLGGGWQDRWDSFRLVTPNWTAAFAGFPYDGDDPDISTVIWTSGYRLDFGWIDLPIFDELGFPRHVRGVTEVAGLHFLGLPWLVDQGSATLFGVRRDAAQLAARLMGSTGTPDPGHR